MSSFLQDLFFNAAKKFPQRIALEEISGNTINYEQLEKLVNEKCDFFQVNGIKKNSRVAVMAPKSIETVSILLAILKTGAAYIPIDLQTPSERLQQIIRNLDPQAFIAHSMHFPSEIPCQQQFMAGSLSSELSISFFTSDDTDPIEDLAYILYTSGSTGDPKGVCISHRNARAFTDWCLRIFPVTEKDRFSSIAPFHFDLSVFDLYVNFGCGGTLVLMDDTLTKNARLLAEIIESKKISVVYATPSALSLLLNFGKIQSRNYEHLQLVLFAGEVFPVKQLHGLMNTWNLAKFYNLYGPTETNVCTFLQIPRPIDEHRTEPYPIGKICSHLEGKITMEGELLIAGDNVTAGYWKRNDLNAFAFVEYGNKRFYKTGDRIEETPTGDLVYVGRMDRMIKKRGYRIEPEEIETILSRHPDVMEAAVIGSKDAEGYTFLKAFLAARPSAVISLIDIKQHCMDFLPAYMVPEQIIFVDALPKTSSGKMDLKALERR